jgi:hypothetical protein
MFWYLNSGCKEIYENFRNLDVVIYLFAKSFVLQIRFSWQRMSIENGV